LKEVNLDWGQCVPTELREKCWAPQATDGLAGSFSQTPPVNCDKVLAIVTKDAVDVLIDEANKGIKFSADQFQARLDKIKAELKHKFILFLDRILEAKKTSDGKIAFSAFIQTDAATDVDRNGVKDVINAAIKAEIGGSVDGAVISPVANSGSQKRQAVGSNQEMFSATITPGADSPQGSPSGTPPPTTGSAPIATGSASTVMLSVVVILVALALLM